MSEVLNTDVDETSNVETIEKETPETSESISRMLGESEGDVLLATLSSPTDNKPQYWETQEEIDENLDGFDPPGSDDEPIVINPDKILKSPTTKNLVKKGSNLVAPIVVDVIDSVIPPMINIYAKADDYERFCADDDAKETMSDAFAELMGSQDVELSPTWTFVLAVLAAYTPACIDAFGLRRANEKIAKQEKQIDFYKATIDEQERENKRLEREAEKKELAGEKEIELLRKEIADLKETSATTELKAKRISAKEVKTPKKSTKIAKSKK